jgi:DNA-binding Lrp family transcriptional regulator
MKIPEVKEVRGVYGAFDIFAKVQSDDIAEHQDVIDKIRRIKNVRSTNTHMAIEKQGGR